VFRKLVVSFLFVGLLGAACTSSSAHGPSPLGGRSPSAPASAATASGYHPTIDPANFASAVDNPYFILTPGTTFVYEGTKDGESQRDVVEVLSRKKVILGVTCTVVSDVATHDGKPLEATEDWYAQDKHGNVWYFGEDTKEYDEHGKVASTEGSWESGVDGAQPGIVMPAHPQVTESHRQEFYQGHAQDMFWVLSLSQKITVPYGSSQAALLTMEWTPLDPKVIDQKYYVPGVGLVLEASATGPNERTELVSVNGP
jgi:hypothetical protein